MYKKAQKYLEVHPWKLIEKGFNEERALVSESLFSIANEYMGIRGFFDENYNSNQLIGTYFNGIYEVPDNINRSAYKGVSDKLHYMVNSTNIFYTNIYIDGELFIFKQEEINNYFRELDFKNGKQIRTYNIKDLFKITFTRILNMNINEIAHQLIEIEPLNYYGTIKIELGISLDVKHWGRDGKWQVLYNDNQSLLAKTTTNQSIFNKFKVNSNIEFKKTIKNNGKINKLCLEFDLKENVIIEKTIVSLINKSKLLELDQSLDIATNLLNKSDYKNTLKTNTKFYEEFWNNNDIIIEGDLDNQQGIRYCLFQLVNTYHGLSSNNIGAKGLTGEAYSGHAFWDTETYCLPFYLFSNTNAAKNLLMFRYNTLNQARERAKELDCIGAAYPIATLNGYEACDLWQHASLQLQPTSSVSYAIWHYVKITKDKQFLIDYGFEMLLEIARFFGSRGQYNKDKNIFSYYGVMGPDEFQMMVNHNIYTNYLAKKSIDYFLDVYNELKSNTKISEVIKKLNFTETELEDLISKSKKMYIPLNNKTKIYEQHDGFFDLPHIDIKSIPLSEIPLYSNWTYDRIYRNNIIKQPDVLMFMFLYNQSFDFKTKKANYDYYEPLTIHESSLSPSIHSIFASELGYEEQAYDFFRFATRMDLDDYNRNTSEGLHLTSIAAAWLNIVYGFGGFRSDGINLKLAPILPNQWQSYQFSIVYQDVNIKVQVFKDHINVNLNKLLNEEVTIYNKLCKLNKGENIIKRNVDN